MKKSAYDKAQGWCVDDENELCDEDAIRIQESNQEPRN